MSELLVGSATVLLYISIIDGFVYLNQIVFIVIIIKSYGSGAMFKLLTTFRAVYETRNFSRAAEVLFLSQPAVSNQIKQLERELNIDLFSVMAEKRCFQLSKPIYYTSGRWFY